MASESDTGTHAVVLTSFELAKLDEVSSELANTLLIDIKTASSMLQHTPIVVFEGLSENVAGIVVKNMKKLTDTGCEFKIAVPPLETQRKMRWPKPHRVVVEAKHEASAQAGIDQNEDGSYTIECPTCKGKISISLVGTIGEEKLIIGAAAPAKETTRQEIERKLDSVPEKELPKPVGIAGFMELDEFEAGLAELETDHGPMKSPEPKRSDDIPGGSAQLIDFEEAEEVPLKPMTSPGAGNGGIDTEIKAAIRELDDELPSVPEISPAKPVSNKLPTEIAKTGPAVYSVILPQIRSEKKRGEAALIISRVLKIPEENALDLTNRVIITVARDLTEAHAEQLRGTFEQHGFKARVTKKK